MDETELANMVVRLIGDGTEYRAMLKQASDDTVKAADQIQTHAQRIEGFSRNLSGYAQSAVGALGALGLATSLGGAFHSYADYERNQIRLTAAIRAGAHEVGPTVAQYNRLASELEKVTLVTRGEITAMARQAETLGHSGDNAERVIRNAVALAGATDSSAESMLRIASEIERGNYHMVRRVLHLHNIKDETELIRIVNQRMVSGMEQQRAIVGSASGQLEILGRSLKGVTREMGGLVAEAIMPVVSMLRIAVDWFKSLDPSIRTATAAVIAFMLAFKFIPILIGWLASAGLAMKAFMMTIVTNPITFWIVAAAAAIAIVIKLRQEIGLLREDMRTLRSETERGERLQTQIVAMHRGETARIISQVETSPMGDRRAMLNTEIDRARKELEDRQRGVANHEREIRRLQAEMQMAGGGIGGGFGVFPGVGQGLAALGVTSDAPALIQGIQRELAGLGQVIEADRDRVAQLQAALARLSLESARSEINKTTGEVWKQIETFDLEKDQIERLHLAEVISAAGGDVDTMLVKFDQLSERLRVLQVEKTTRSPLEQFAKDANRLQPLLNAGLITLEQFQRSLAKDTIEGARTDVQKFQEQLALMNAMLARGAISQEVWRRTLGGDTIKEAMTPLQQFDERLVLMNAKLQAGVITADEWRRSLGGKEIDEAMTSLERFSQHQGVLNRMVESGVLTITQYNRILGGETTRQFMLPIEKFTERQAELNQMWEAGVITLETYNRALEAARKNLEGTTIASRDAALATSAEARSRVADYLAINRTIELTAAQHNQTFNVAPGGAGVNNPPVVIAPNPQRPDQQNANGSNEVTVIRLPEIIDELKESNENLLAILEKVRGGDSATNTIFELLNLG